MALNVLAAPALRFVVVDIHRQRASLHIFPLPSLAVL